MVGSAYGPVFRFRPAFEGFGSGAPSSTSRNNTDTSTPIRGDVPRRSAPGTSIGIRCVRRKHRQEPAFAEGTTGPASRDVRADRPPNPVPNGSRRHAAGWWGRAQTFEGPGLFTATVTSRNSSTKIRAYGGACSRARTGLGIPCFQGNCRETSQVSSATITSGGEVYLFSYGYRELPCPPEQGRLRGNQGPVARR
jgi:hypothetical protein